MKITLGLFVGITLLVWCSVCHSVVYYVDCNADGDAGAGTSTAANVAWKTINKVNTSTFNAGDSILFNRGCTWREQLTMPSSGSSGSPITVSSYGTGAAPIISGSPLVSTFSVVSNAHGGTYCVNVTIDGSNSDAGISQSFSLPGSTAMTLSIWAKSSAGGAICQFVLTHSPNRYLKTDGTWQDGFTSTAVGGATWAQTSISFTTEGAGTYTFTTYRTGGAAGNSYYLDDISVNDGSTEYVVDGGFENWTTSTNATSWTEAKAGSSTVTQDGPTSVWTAALTTEPTRVWFDGTLGTEVASAALCNSANKWYWASNVLYVYSTTDPDSAYTAPGIEAATLSSGIITGMQDYITIDGFAFKRQTLESILVNCWTVTSPTGIIVQNNTITDVDLYGILVGNTGGTFKTPNNVTIQNNTITNYHRAYPGPGSGYTSGTITAPAIYVAAGDGSGGDGITISGNTITSDITGQNANQYRDGIYITTGDNLTITGNTITGSDHGIVVCGPETAGCYAETHTISKNYVHDTADDGIWLQGTNATDSKINYNLLVRNGDQGIATQACGAGSYGSIDNNTIISSYECSALFIFGIGSTNFRNNIIYDYATHNSNADPTNGNVVAAVCLSTGTANLGTGTVDNNIYYKSGNSTPFYELTLTARTLTQWKGDMSKDASSVSADPLFINASAGDFRLRPSSPARNAGTDVSLTTDYEGRSVPKGSAPDIGAYEYPSTGQGGGGSLNLLGVGK